MATANVDRALEALESHAGRLNRVSDEANEKLVEIENRIVKMNIGMEYWYSPAVKRDDATGTFSREGTSEELIQVLGFARVAGRWCLAIKPIRLVKGYFQGDENCPFEDQYAGGDIVPLLKTSRDLRVAALLVLEDFLARFTEHVVSATEAIKKAKV